MWPLLIIILIVPIFVHADPIHCTRIVGYYLGNFASSANKPLNAEFQIRFDLDWPANRVRLYVDHYNCSYSDGENPYFHYFLDTFSTQTRCVYPFTVGCSLPIPSPKDSLTLHIHNGDDVYQMMYFQSLVNNFTIDNPVGQCTNQMNNTGNRLVKAAPPVAFCFCCDEYKTDDALSCPKDPWITTSTSSFKSDGFLKERNKT